MSTSPDHHELLATAYLLGHATPEQVSEFKTLEARDADFRKLVQDLSEWLAPLNEGVPEEAPPANLLDDIFGEIDRQSAADDTQMAQNRTSPVTSPGLWRPAALAASFIAAVALGSHFVPQAPITPDELQVRELVALLAADDKPGAIAIVYRPATGELTADFAAIPLPEDAVWQLWRIRDGAPIPVSLGLLNDRTEPGRFQLTFEDQVLSPADTIAISLEPVGGSTQEGPSGPVLFASAVSEL